MSSPLKAVVDHHVDRPGVEVERSMQLTGTNRLIGLIALIRDTHCSSAKPMSGNDTKHHLGASRDNPFGIVAAHIRDDLPCKSRGLHLSFAGLVALARSPNPIPSRTRPLNSSAPMVLCLKTWESRSLPGLQKTVPHHHTKQHHPQRGVEQPGSSSGS
jgi:hypothetical protein